jgi:hypothetical protein
MILVQPWDIIDCSEITKQTNRIWFQENTAVGRFCISFAVEAELRNSVKVFSEASLIANRTTKRPRRWRAKVPAVSRQPFVGLALAAGLGIIFALQENRIRLTGR